MKTGSALFAAMLVAATPVLAAVDGSGESGFAVTETAHIDASPAKVFDAFTAPSRWWSSAHTYSQHSENLTFDAKAGGCWCETLPSGGSVQHMTVIYILPGKTVRLRGALGPLQAMGVDGAMTVTFKPAGNGADVTVAYAVGGYSRDGFADLAQAVDRVLGEQLMRLRKFTETGSPEPAQSSSMSR